MESHKFGMSQASNYKSKVFHLLKDTNPQSQVVAQASHTNDQASLYCFLDGSVKLSEVTFPDSEGAIKCPMEEQKEMFQ